jgi:hypothetical protein
MSRLKKWTRSQFLGRQLSRLRNAQTYYAIIVSTINAISLISLAFHVEFWVLLALFPVLLGATLWVGLYMDTHGIIAQDSLKTAEMANRFLNTGDVKAQEFQLLQTEILLEALQALQDKRSIDATALRQKYETYLKKWKSPES